MQNLSRKSAILSVADKTHLAEFAKNKLQNYTLYASGGTLTHLLDNGVNAKSVEEIPGVNPMLGGLVKTLSYSILAGILYDRNNESHVAQMKNLPLIDLVVCNFYPQEIDIGGPNMIRASLKNWKHVTCITDPADYEKFDPVHIDREYFRMKAYNYLFEDLISLGTKDILQPLTYGENPHQKAFLGSKEFTFSFNNIRDIEPGLKLLEDKTLANAVCIIKHQIPCCYIESNSISGNELLNRAFEIDSTSAYGGVVVSNNTFEENTFPKKFLDLIVNPNGSGKARKTARLPSPRKNKLNIYPTFAGALVQEENRSLSEKFNIKTGKEIDFNLARFSERLSKIFKSNAVLITTKSASGDLILLGQGSGEPNRIDCFRKLALPRAIEASERLKKFYPEISNRHNWLVFSDGFYPFADSVEEIYNAEILNVIEPGGSKNDEDVINFAKSKNMNLSFSQFRHFTH